MEDLTQHEQLRQAADAARLTLTHLEEEFAALLHRVKEMSESIQLLQGVVHAWERIHPERDAFAHQLVCVEQSLQIAALSEHLRALRSSAGLGAETAPADRLAAKPQAKPAAQQPQPGRGESGKEPSPGTAAWLERMSTRTWAKATQAANTATDVETSLQSESKLVQQLHAALAAGGPQSPEEAQHAVKNLFEAAYPLDVVKLALRYGVYTQQYVQDRASGKYRLAGI